MALSFRRSRETPSDPVASTAVDAHTLHDLERAHDRQVTGALHVEDRATGSTARIFMFRGHPYSVQIDGYSPRIPARLVSSGLLTVEQAAEVGDDPRAGQLAVTRGWITAEQLGSVHQELMLAGFGAAVVVARPHLRFEEDLVTDLDCAAPVALEPLIDSVPVRSTRLASTWSTLVITGDPSGACFVGTGTPLPDAVDRAEFRSLLAALGSGISLDEAAWQAGFTRAEAVHLTGILVAAQVVALSGQHGQPPTDHLLVPEQFGHRHLEAQVPVAQALPLSAEEAPHEESEAEEAANRAELHELHAALAVAIEEERRAAARVGELRERVQQLTESLGGTIDQ